MQNLMRAYQSSSTPIKQPLEHLEVQQLGGRRVALRQDKVTEADGQHRFALQPFVRHHLLQEEQEQTFNQTAQRMCSLWWRCTCIAAWHGTRQNFGLVMQEEQAACGLAEVKLYEGSGRLG